MNFELLGSESARKHPPHTPEAYSKCGLTKDVYTKEGDFRFNYLYILIYTNNINLIWRDNVFEHLNRNIQYIKMSVFTCTEYLKSKKLSKQVCTG